ncbi:MAG: peptidyl-prolyl cis-trans isomerase [Nevskia sp.]|nr:peptidyl-prolyl cis-trans isomerase [Nevskia sp.]
MATLTAAVPAPPRRLLLRRLLREPFLHFVLLGAALFLAGQHLQRHPERYRIVLGRAQLDEIARNYARQYGAEPSPAQLRSLADHTLQEEIYFREALALNLDRDDQIVRRRLVQKYEFLQQDLIVPREPDALQLQRHYEQNASRYTQPARRSFTHVYFSPDEGGDARAQARALQALAQLQAQGRTRAPELGDRFADLYDYAQIGQADAARVFGQSGQSGLPQALFEAPLHQWSGPYRSGYGWHLLYVTDEQAPRLPPLAEVRERVHADYLDDERQQADAAAYARLLAKYEVKREAQP